MLTARRQSDFTACSARCFALVFEARGRPAIYIHRPGTPFELRIEFLPVVDGAGDKDGCDKLFERQSVRDRAALAFFRPRAGDIIVHADEPQAQYIVQNNAWGEPWRWSDQAQTVFRVRTRQIRRQ